MGVLDKRISVAVNSVLKDMEGKLLKQQNEAIEHNRALMLLKLDEIKREVRDMVKEEVKLGVCK